MALSSLASAQSLAKHARAPPAAGAVVWTNGTLSNSSVTLNHNTLAYGAKTYQYSKSGYSIYTLLNTTALPTTTVNGTNGTGTFTLTVTGSTSTIYLLLIGAGGSGGGGDSGGGGGSSGEFKYVSVSLPVGTYSCSYTVGAGNGGSGWVGSQPYYAAGNNGFGIPGNNTTITINGTTYTALGGSPGGTSYYNNTATVGAYGGGSGSAYLGSGTSTGSTGQIKNHGGGNPVAGVYGGAGGGSPMGNGSNGVVTDGSTGSPAAGGLGGAAIGSTDSSLSGSPFYNMRDTSGGVMYWCEGGPGACWAGAGSSTLNPTPTYGLAGKASGVPIGAATRATQTVNHSGSGGGGQFQTNGLNGTTYAPAGSNGLILVAF